MAWNSPCPTGWRSALHDPAPGGVGLLHVLAIVPFVMTHPGLRDTPP
ncbi:hypothetical protein [Komagataeibacter medellinensis]|nr:hypothetical protein [Komagataeibacter medellinensis]